MDQKITMKDLAQMIGTTSSTVSRALQNDPRISEKMRSKVIDLAKKHNYKVNPMASSLRSGKSRTLGIIVPRINRDFFSNVISGIESVASEAGYKVVIGQSHDDLASEVELLDNLVSSGVSGVLVSCGLGTNTHDHFKKAQLGGVPIVFFDRVQEEIDTVKIVNDDNEGALKAVNHLIQKGYKRIAHFSGPTHINVYRHRQEGYEQALKNAGVKVDPSLIIEDGLSQKSGAENFKKLLALKNPPDALFCASDYSALGAILQLKETKNVIASNFGIVGYGNEQWSSFISPSLTTVDQHPFEMGEFCAKVFLEEIENKHNNIPPRTIKLSPKLIVRESSN